MKEVQYKELCEACDQFIDIVKVRFSNKHNKLIKIIFEYCNKKFDDLNIEPLIRVLSN